MGKKKRENIAAVQAELDTINLGDRRRDARAKELIGLWAAHPDSTFPDMSQDKSDLEALYRFFSNDDISFQEILAPHFAATAMRCSHEKLVLAIHDVTEFSFSGWRDGFIEAGEKSTFHAHVSIAVRPAFKEGEAFFPMGTLGLTPFLSNRGTKGRLSHGISRRKDVRALRYQQPRETKESFLWDVGVLTAEQTAGPNATLIHVADQEVDDYAHLSHLVENNFLFVIRGDPQRRALDGKVKLPARDIIEAETHVFFRDVTLTGRKRKSGGHSARDVRTAELHIRATPLVFEATRAASANLPELSLNYVQVFEPNPPSGEEPIEWALFTSLPIGTQEEQRFIVDAYRARWMIEEFFKAIKTGCAYEERQLCTGQALLNVLALCLPIAYRMLALRAAARSKKSSLSANLFLSPRQIKLLKHLRPKSKLPDSPSLQEALWAIASLGGHLKNNGDPGWLTLWRGYSKFLSAELHIEQLSEFTP